MTVVWITSLKIVVKETLGCTFAEEINHKKPKNERRRKSLVVGFPLNVFGFPLQGDLQKFSTKNCFLNTFSLKILRKALLAILAKCDFWTNRVM
jgi:hypothetical protein